MPRQQYENDSVTETLATALGWFSIGLGAAELIAPASVARLVGVSPRERHTRVLRAFGAREMVSGFGILSDPTNPNWFWSRVGGDALDLASLGTAAARRNVDGGRLSWATAAVLGVTVLDILCAKRLDAAGVTDEFSVQPGHEQAITVRGSLERAESAWVDWCVSGHSKLKSDYAVRFEPAPAARGTEVRLSGGASKSVLREELRQFKQLLETGEISVSDGRGFRRPARPSGETQQANTSERVVR